MIRTAADWRSAREEGLARFLLRQGVLRRGLPMALVTLLVVQAARGELDAEAFRSAEVHLRFLAALAVFSLGGVLSALAQWKAFERRFSAPPPQPPEQ